MEPALSELERRLDPAVFRRIPGPRSGSWLCLGSEDPGGRIRGGPAQDRRASGGEPQEGEAPDGEVGGHLVAALLVPESRGFRNRYVSILGLPEPRPKNSGLAIPKADLMKLGPGLILQTLSIHEGKLEKAAPHRARRNTEEIR